jgi:hypothetical protein
MHTHEHIAIPVEYKIIICLQQSTMMMFSILMLCLMALFELSAGDKFESLDRNFDGQLDRSEFAVLSHELHEVLEPFTDEFKGKTGSLKVTDFIGGEISGDFVTGTVNSLIMIVACEIGDKTFFIAAVLAMRNGRFIVYLGSMGALAVMHILSCLMVSLSGTLTLY